MAHLYHFCTTVPTDRYSDPRPQFSLHAHHGSSFTAEVVLPASIDPSLRFARSSRNWWSQDQARKDAAFQAYVRLHRHGLVNDNLLPLIKDFEEKHELQGQHTNLSLLSVPSEIDPWQEVRRRLEMQNKASEWNCAAASLRFNGIEYLKCVVLLPVDIAPIHGLEFCLSTSIRFELGLVPLRTRMYKDANITIPKRSTFAMLRSAFGSRIAEGEDFLLNILPTEPLVPIRCEAKDIYKKMKGQNEMKQIMNLGLVYEKWRCGVRWIFGGFRWGYEVETDWAESYRGNITPTQLYIQAKRLPKKRNFLNSFSYPSKQPIIMSKKELLLAEDCFIDEVPLPYTVLGYSIPIITHRLWGIMLAKEFSKSIPSTVQFSCLELMLASITASSASETMNYQRLEFLGDCVLKYCTSLQLMAQRETWPESYLTAAKERLISNRSLTKVSITHGFSRFLISKGVKVAKWRPHLVRGSDEQLNRAKVLRSAKVLADIVEALIGASFVENGMRNALTLLRELMPHNTWYEHDNAVAKLYSVIPVETTFYSQGCGLEDILGYNFSNKLLLREALTHASFALHGELCNLSYERLEFLGDAILDQIVSDIIFSHRPSLPHSEMHSIRTAVVSTAFLAFTCIEYIQTGQSSQPIEQVTKGLKMSGMQRSIWQYMRHASTEIPFAQTETLTRHDKYRYAINYAMKEENRHPWHILSNIRASKFFADIIESVLGAIFIDSGGNLLKCLTFLERIGITTYLRRVLNTKVDCLHPKERLGILAGSNKVRYYHQKYGQIFRCWVYLNETILGTFTESPLLLDAEVKAAWAASVLLESSK